MHIEIGPCAFGTRINDSEWGCNMAVQAGQSLIEMQMHLPLLGRVKVPAKEWFAHKRWKRYKSVLCFGFHMPLEDMFRARKGQQLTANLLLSGRCGSEIILHIKNWTKSQTFRNITISGIRSHFQASNEVCQSYLPTK
jgi:hypothetical protein